MGKKTFLYIGYVGFSNLGDDALKDVFVEQISDVCRHMGDRAHVVSRYAQQLSEDRIRELNPDLVVLGGGSILTPGYVRPLRDAQKLGIPTVVWGSGVDHLSLQQLGEIESGRLPALASGFARPLRETLHNCAHIGVRGPHTQRVLEAAGVDPGTIEVVGDPGLHVSPKPFLDPSHDPLKPLVAAPYIIAVNWGTTRNRLFGKSEETVLNHLEKVVRHLAVGCGVFLFPMWTEDFRPLRRLADRLHGLQNMVVWNRLAAPSVLASLLARCRYSVNFKLHANIFSAAVGRPFVSLAYRSKCYDFLSSISMGELGVSTASKRLSDELLDRCAQLEREYDEYRRRIDEQRSRYAHKLFHYTTSCASLVR